MKLSDCYSAVFCFISHVQGINNCTIIRNIVMDHKQLANLPDFFIGNRTFSVDLSSVSSSVLSLRISIPSAVCYIYRDQTRTVAFASRLGSQSTLSRTNVNQSHMSMLLFLRFFRNPQYHSLCLCNHDYTFFFFVSVMRFRYTTPTSNSGCGVVAFLYLIAGHDYSGLLRARKSVHQAALPHV